MCLQYSCDESKHRPFLRYSHIYPLSTINSDLTVTLQYTGTLNLKAGRTIMALKGDGTDEKVLQISSKARLSCILD